MLYYILAIHCENWGDNEVFDKAALAGVGGWTLVLTERKKQIYDLWAGVTSVSQFKSVLKSAKSWFRKALSSCFSSWKRTVCSQPGRLLFTPSACARCFASPGKALRAVHTDAAAGCNKTSGDFWNKSKETGETNWCTYLLPSENPNQLRMTESGYAILSYT